MNWTNWITYANQVLNWILGVIPNVIDVMLLNPVLGVPIMLVIVSLVFRIVLQFVGSLGGRNKSES